MTRAAREDTRFRLSEGQARALVEAYGTPLYTIDEAHLRARIRRYKSAFAAAWPKCELSFASKANSTLAVLAIAHREGCKIDVASEGELRAALAAGVPAADCHLHGSNKSMEELQFAVHAGTGQIVIDHFDEIEMVAAALGGGTRGRVQIVLRLAPGVDPVTHHAISTGQADTKFGFNITDGSAERATLQCLEIGLPLEGFHCHVGSQLLDPEAQETGGALIARFAAEMKRRHGFSARYINVGGGLGVTYIAGQEPTPLEDYCRIIAAAVRMELQGSGLEPVLGQEPGRALIAESGTTLYRVGVIKTVPAPGRGTRTYVSVDGGLSDNPRPAIYDAKYTVERVALAIGAERDRQGASIKATISGKHCESDMLFEDIELPGDLAAGDILQVLCTGAYNSSMASNYNRYPRPATAMIMEDGSHVLVQRRDTWDEMLARELLPKGLS